MDEAGNRHLGIPFPGPQTQPPSFLGPLTGGPDLYASSPALYYYPNVGPTAISSTTTTNSGVDPLVDSKPLLDLTHSTKSTYDLPHHHHHHHHDRAAVLSGTDPRVWLGWREGQGLGLFCAGLLLTPCPPHL
ncbi:hypothetical protein ACOMHN_045964 [Nucella lapillus]